MVIAYVSLFRWSLQSQNQNRSDRPGGKDWPLAFLIFGRDGKYVRELWNINKMFRSGSGMGNYSLDTEKFEVRHKWRSGPNFHRAMRTNSSLIWLIINFHSVFVFIVQTEKMEYMYVC